LNEVPWGFYKVLTWINQRYKDSYHPVIDIQTMKMMTDNNNNKNNGIDSPRMERSDGNHVIEGRQSKMDAKLPIYITENGCDVPNESHLSFDDIINDKFR
jgi:hypothetical protein